MLIFHYYKHAYLHLYLYNDCDNPGEALQFFAYIPGDIWTIQHLTYNGHWPHDRHDLAERFLTFITI